jgi:hypothetical protein
MESILEQGQILDYFSYTTAENKELKTKLQSLQAELDTLREGRAGIAIISYFSYVSPMALIQQSRPSSSKILL